MVQIEVHGSPETPSMTMTTKQAALQLVSERCYFADGDGAFGDE